MLQVQPDPLQLGPCPELQDCGSWYFELMLKRAGEARIKDVVLAGGFTRFRRVAETPFNLVFEARP